MDKDALKLIKNCKKEYSKQSQRAELLRRNKQFIEEFKKINKSLGEEFFSTMQFVRNFSTQNYFDGVLPDAISKNLADKFSDWMLFCDRWHINEGWDRKLQSLENSIRKSPLLIISLDSKGERETIDIRIDAWTTLEDIHAMWPKIDQAKKRVFIQKAEKRSNFARDLCWYDFKNKYKKSYRQIAEIWNEYFPNEIDLLVISNLKKEKFFIEAVDEYICKNKLLLSNVCEFKDEELLTEIKEGKLTIEIGPMFYKQREFYTTGITNQGKFSPPFVSMIKQAVKRFTKYIDFVDLKTEAYYPYFAIGNK